MASSIILNIPHSSTLIPSRDRSVFLPLYTGGGFIGYVRSENKKDETIGRNLIPMTDWYTDELFDHGIGKAVVAAVSRLVCDTERFSHDEEEAMAERGMGFCYERGFDGETIKEFSQDYKDEVLWRYYAPHHIALTDAVEEALEYNRKALVIDCHSFSPEPLFYEDDQNPQRPDICLGTDDYHTPRDLVEKTSSFLSEWGLSVSINSPYAGTMVPLRYYRKDKRVMSIMIEVNRGLYLENGTSEKSENFPKIQKMIQELEVMLEKVIRGYK